MECKGQTPAGNGAQRVDRARAFREGAEQAPLEEAVPGPVTRLTRQGGAKRVSDAGLGTKRV